MRRKPSSSQSHHLNSFPKATKSDEEVNDKLGSVSMHEHDPIDKTFWKSLKPATLLHLNLDPNYHLPPSLTHLHTQAKEYLAVETFFEAAMQLLLLVSIMQKDNKVNNASGAIVFH
jgi:hypothetical protein